MPWKPINFAVGRIADATGRLECPVWRNPGHPLFRIYFMPVYPGALGDHDFWVCRTSELFAPDESGNFICTDKIVSLEGFFVQFPLPHFS
jgi:hypothetical protein